MFKLKHHILISCVLLLSIILIGFKDANNYPENEIIWTNEPVDWSNFSEVKELEDDYVASMYSEIFCPNQISWINSEVYAYMDPNLSNKLTDSLLDNQVLIHEQYHFNITEYYARLLRKDIVKIGKNKLTKKTIDSLYEKYNLQKNIMQVQFDSITDHNGNTEKERFWELKIDDLLRQTSYYENKDILSYQNYDNGETEYYKYIYITHDNQILCSYPIYEENSQQGGVYKVNVEDNDIIISFFKNGILSNGGILDTAITTITKTKDSIITKYFNPNYTLNESLDYCINKTYLVDDQKLGYYFDSKSQRISVDGVYQTIWKSDSIGRICSTYYNNNQNRISNKEGVNIKKRTFDDLGRTEKLEFYDSNNNPINDNDFASKVIIERNDKHKVIRYKLYEKNGGFATHLNSYNLKYEYDERGNLKRSINLNENSDKASNKKGVCINKYTYDLNDNQTSVKKFNKADNLF